MTSVSELPEPNSTGSGNGRTRDLSGGGVFVAGLAILAVVAIVLVATFSLPDPDKAKNVVAIASAGFGVVGAIVGSYFAVRSADKSVERAVGQRASQHEHELRMRRRLDTKPNDPFG